MFRFFAVPMMVTLAAIAVVGLWGGWTALFVTALLVVLEVTLSFDNAVVNARVLKRLSDVWQRRFLTWGIFISVVVTRAILPIVIVALATGTHVLSIAHAALYEPAHYGELLHKAHYVISTFGGVFLLLVGLRYFIDDEKDVHWIHAIEKRLSRWGTIESAVIGMALAVLFFIALLLPYARSEILFSGLFGALVFIVLQGIVSAFGAESDGLQRSGLILFIYLNILDAAFSLDSVVGAFALSTQLPVIIAGLGAGAYFVRVLTLYMVKHRVLDTLMYLEHGAHWAILGLAASMLANLFIDFPEPIIGLIGLVLVTFAYVSSVKIGKKVG